jgi:hypothetical protein
METDYAIAARTGGVLGKLAAGEIQGRMAKLMKRLEKAYRQAESDDLLAVTLDNKITIAQFHSYCELRRSARIL